MLHLLPGGSSFVFDFYLLGPFNSIFFSPNPIETFFLALGVVNAGSHVGPWNKIGHLIVVSTD